MATYYVRPDGSNSNAGTGSASNQAWQTITYALANMVLTTGVNYLYVAPGTYRESPVVTITPSSTNTLVISGDPKAQYFPNIVANQVRVTGASSDIAVSASGTRFDLGSKTYITLENFCIDHNGAGGTYAISSNGSNITIRKNVIHSYYLGGGVGGGIRLLPALQSDNNILIDSNILWGVAFGIYVGLAPNVAPVTSASSGVVIQNCRIHGNGWQNCFPISVNPQYSTVIASVTISNCIILQSMNGAIGFNYNTTGSHIVQNCIIAMCSQGIVSSNGASVTQRNNLLFTGGNLVNVTSDASTITSDYMGFDLGQSLLHGISGIPFGTILGSRNTNFGTSLLAPSTDGLGYSWTGPAPDLGTTTYRSVSSLGTFIPSERNASAISIAPNSINRIENIYLGVTGLTYLTTGLTASYIRAGNARVGINLVSQTPTGAWTSGGFCEIDPVNTPGMYRIDVPNAAFISGTTSVTLTIKNANGSNGTYLNYTLQPVHIDLTQTVPYSNAVQTIGDALNAARSSGFGKWTLNDKTLTLYGGDNTTVVKTFTLNSSTYPTERS